jgi:hypothetical protein
MAIVGLSQSATQKFVSPRDPAKGTPEETVFTLGTLDVFLAAYITDNMVAVSAEGNSAAQG